MLSSKIIYRFAAVVAAITQSAVSATIPAALTSVNSVPVTATHYKAVGNEIALSLDFAPQAGCNLTVVNVTGLDFIEGRFSNLAQGQVVNLTNGGETYRFAANYYGGTGNDLVLHWANQELGVWGDNTSGQLGNGKIGSEAVPVGIASEVPVLASRTVTAIASGESHHLALCSDGALVTWGSNNDGQLGIGRETSSDVPILVNHDGALAGKTVVSIAAGRVHNIVLCSDGTMVTWGGWFTGDFGNNSPNFGVPIKVDQSGVLAGKTVVKIAAGGMHCLALCSDGTLVSWGNMILGNGGEDFAKTPILVDRNGVLAGKQIVDIAAGDSLGLAICSDGTVATWGRKDHGQLGNGISELGATAYVPIMVKNDGILAGRKVVAAAAGRFHVLALCADGTLATWGYNGHGTLGTGTTTSSSVPVAVDQSGFLAGRRIVSVMAGEYSSAAISSDGTLAELGGGSKTPAYASDGVLKGKAVISVTFGDDKKLAVCSDGTIGQWTGNAPPVLAKLGDPVLTPLSGKTIVSIAAGGWHTLALCADGTLAAWGDNNSGQLGIGGYSLATTIYRLDGKGALAGKSVVAVAAGSNHSLALCSDGTLVTWGTDGITQASDPNYNVPKVVSRTGGLAGKKVVAIEAGNFFSLALCSDGTVVAWGSNSNGQLGDGTTSTRKTPVEVNRSGALMGRSVVRISTKLTHSLALCADGKLIAWGSGSAGQLGNGASVEGTSIPVAVDQSGVLAGKTIVSIKALHSSSLVLCSDGTLSAWGTNQYGELGDGSTTRRNSPVLVDQTGVLAGRTVVAIEAGWRHSVAICSDSTLASWGANNTDQLGIGTHPDPDQAVVPQLVVDSEVLARKKVTSLAIGGGQNLAILAAPSPSLKSIAPSAGQLSFDPFIKTYAFAVPQGTSAISFTPTYSTASSTTIQGATVASGVPSTPIPLEIGINSVSVNHTESNGFVTSYTIFVIRKTLSGDAGLSALQVERGSFNPGFSPQSVIHTAGVPYEASSVRVSPVASDSNAKIIINNTPLSGQGAGLLIPLKVGDNTVKIKITAENGIQYAIHTLRITRRAAVPYLADLKPSIGKLTPAFSKSVYAYRMTVSSSTASIKVTPICKDKSAVLTVNGVRISSGAPSKAVKLKVGVNTLTVSISTSSKADTKSYSIQITRPSAPDTRLAKLSVAKAKLSPLFKSTVNGYSAVVSNATRSVTIVATGADKGAEITVNNAKVKSGKRSQAISLALGKNIVSIKVKGKSGGSNTYKIIITRASAEPVAHSLQSVGIAPGKTNGTSVSKIVSESRTYLQIVTPKRNDGSRPLIEVSSNLMEWFSGDNYTGIVVDDKNRFGVRDLTPTSTSAKRYIRLRWLRP